MTKNSARSLHLVDIENLIGHARPAAADVHACYNNYLPLMGEQDIVIVACNHGAFLSVAWAWPQARRLVRSGEDGADYALLDVLKYEGVEGRFASVVIGSGDGIFADTAARLGRLGIAVTVVSRREALSRRLRMAAGRVVELSALPAKREIGEPA